MGSAIVLGPGRSEQSHKADEWVEEEQLVDQLFRDVPAGLGGRSDLSLSDPELDDLMVRGAAWMVDQGYAVPY